MHVFANLGGGPLLKTHSSSGLMAALLDHCFFQHISLVEWDRTLVSTQWASEAHSSEL
jgi:hypothetical protein